MPLNTLMIFDETIELGNSASKKALAENLAWNKLHLQVQAHQLWS